jgi:DNA-binding transcriptional LysR family regulator
VIPIDDAYSLRPTLRRLEYFVAVVETGSFTRAAETLHVAQPSLSHQIQALERELGGPLLERVRGAVAPTPAGRSLLPDARIALAASARGARLARSTNRSEGGALHIATHSSIAYGAMPDLIRTWNGLHATVQIAVSEFHHRDALDAALLSGVGDVAIGAQPQRSSGPVSILGYEQFSVVLSPNDPDLTDDPQDPVHLSNLAGRRWVLFNADHGGAAVIQTACAAVGFQPEALTRTGHVAAAAQLAAAGLGPTLIPAYAVPSGLETSARPVDPPVVRLIVAYTRGERLPIVDSLIDVARGGPWLREAPARAIEIP